MKWILIISWAANGIGFTTSPYITEKACISAMRWADIAEKQRSGRTHEKVCLNAETGELKGLNHDTTNNPRTN